MPRKLAMTWVVAAVVMATPRALWGMDLIPPLEEIKTDRPRVLLRPQATPHAASLGQLSALERDADFRQMLRRLRAESHAACQALVWLLEGDEAAAEKAMARMRAYRYPGRVDTFHIYLRLTEFGLAYDWLYGYAGFSDSIKAEVRRNVLPLAQQGYRVTDDHMFHNYIWMSAGGTAIWALATAGEDEASDRLFEQIRTRFNRGLYPAWQYLDGLPSEPMGYWALYVYSPGGPTARVGSAAGRSCRAASPRRSRQPTWLPTSPPSPTKEGRRSRWCISLKSATAAGPEEQAGSTPGWPATLWS